MTDERPRTAHRTSARRCAGPGDALPDASIGTVPILWNNIDVEELRYGTDAATILDEIRRVGYEGTQLGLGFPEGERAAIDARRPRTPPRRGLCGAAVYRRTDRPRTPSRSAGSACGSCTTRAARSSASPSTGRRTAMRPPGVPRIRRRPCSRMPAGTGSRSSCTLSPTEAIAGGHRFAFHPHTGTYVETPAEVERLVAATDAAERRAVPRCRPLPRRRWRPGRGARPLRHEGRSTSTSRTWTRTFSSGFAAGRSRASRPRSASASSPSSARGALDLAGVLRSLASRRYDGWLMVEQDSSWGPPAEAAAIGRRVLAATLRMIAATDAAVAKGA